VKNRQLAKDYTTRAGHRLAALDVLFERESWADDALHPRARALPGP
jgi:hypothetical protein